eukprot:5969023-Pyramimonas_sp.AAC.1
MSDSIPISRRGKLIQPDFFICCGTLADLFVQLLLVPVVPDSTAGIPFCNESHSTLTRPRAPRPDHQGRQRCSSLRKSMLQILWGGFQIGRLFLMHDCVDKLPRKSSLNF